MNDAPFEEIFMFFKFLLFLLIFLNINPRRIYYMLYTEEEEALSGERGRVVLVLIYLWCLRL